LYPVETILPSFTMTAQVLRATHLDAVDISYAILRKFISRNIKKE